MKKHSHKGLATVPIIAIVAVILIIAGVTFGLKKNTVVAPKDTAPAEDTDKMIGDDLDEAAMTMEKDTDLGTTDSMKSMDEIKFTGTVIAGKSAPLIDFNKADYDKALASDKLVVLYFYANWCPICKEETASALYPAFSELTNDGVVGFRVNYKDNQTDTNEENLARQFGVPYQHTKVFVKNGAQVLKSPESWTKARYISEINKALGQ